MSEMVEVLAVLGIASMGIAALTPLVALVIRMIRDGCWHDWEVTRTAKPSDVRRAVDRDRSGKERYAGEVDLFGECESLYVRVCLKCGKVEDTIAAERDRYVAELERKRQRRAKAVEIICR